MKQKKKTPPKSTRAIPTKKMQESVDLFSSIEKSINKNQKYIFYTIFSFAILFGLLLFDVKISEGNDDSLYIEGGYNYATNFTDYYFTANAPMYPMLLGLFTAIFGINLILFKVLSFIFFIAHIYFFFLAFKNRIPGLVLYPVLLLTGINSYFLYYASQTYTESLFLLLQALVLYSFVKVEENENSEGRDSWKSWMMLGLFVFLSTFCKSVAVGGIIALIIFYVITRKWKSIIYFLGAFAAFKIPFEIFKYLIWGEKAKSGQTDTLFLVDPYDITKGKETIGGFVDRFFANLDLYISKRFFQILGFKSADDTTVKTSLSIFVIILMVLGIYWAIKNNSKIIGMLVLYSSALASITFIVLQTRWDQPRLIMVLVPLIMIIILYGIYNLFKKTGFAGQLIYLFLIVVILGSSLIVTTAKSARNIRILKKNLSGDVFYGYTPDWENYLRMSHWCSENLPKDSYVACRKAPMSFVYGNGMKFFPVYNVIAVDTTTNLSNPDSVIATFRREGVTHVILASLRRNPKKVDGYIINTVHRVMEPVARKYPEKIKLIKQIGQSEPAYLYEIIY